MNRRQFFGMSALPVAAAGLPSIVLPERTIFLPPRDGWKPSELGAGYMRETTQYELTQDAMPWRYDAIGRNIWGNEAQFHVYIEQAVPESVRLDIARTVIGDHFKYDGLIAVPIGQSRQFKLELPRHSWSVPARYV